MSIDDEPVVVITLAEYERLRRLEMQVHALAELAYRVVSMEKQIDDLTFRVYNRWREKPSNN